MNQIRSRTILVVACLLYSSAAFAESSEPSDREQAAQLTPIKPNPTSVKKPAFQLYLEIDIPVLAVSSVLTSARLLRSIPPQCRTLDDHCDPAELNALDRHFAGTWRPGWTAYSNYGLATLTVGSAALLLIDEGPLSALNDAVVVAESAFVATALPSMTTLATSRPRPYTYGSRAPLAKRMSGDASQSFISSHTSVSFAVATSMFIAMRRLHPNSALPWLTLGVGLAGATSIASARVFAGQHFPTDVFSGAVIGASVGVIIPSLHELPVQVGPAAAGKGVSVSGNF